MAERLGYLSAIRDFQQARRSAALEQILSRLRGQQDTLFSYDDVRRLVGERNRVDRGLKEIPVDAIVGSVGRYGDFTRTFLPRSDTMQDRWARVKTVATDMGGWTPIEVYQLGEAYFVIDGNHRASVARQMGLETIPAYVTEVRTTVHITPDMDPEQLIIKAREASFLKRVGLDASRPDADLSLTEAGAYRNLEEHIHVHRHYMGIEQQREIPLEEAAAHWYDTVYLPVAHIIRERGLLHDFPDRTETDLYLWLAEHRAELEKALGWEVAPDRAAEDLVTQHGASAQGLLTRVGERIKDAFTPEELEPGPAPGEWRAHQIALRRDERLFCETLVALNGEESGWRALEQAIMVAQHEDGVVRGLHVVREVGDVDEATVQAIQERFTWRLGEVGLRGRFVVERGEVARTVCDRARWNDLVVMPMTHPPGTRVKERLSSGIRTIVQRCPRPLLTVPGEPSPMRRALLAYDGSPTADEALYITTYLAARWESSVVVLTVRDTEQELQEPFGRVRAYLKAHGIDADFEVRNGELAENIFALAAGYGCDFVVMGSYGRQPVMELVLGSGLNDVLRVADIPIFVCR